MGYLLQKVSVIERQEYIGPQGQGSLKVPESLEKLSCWFLNVIILCPIALIQLSTVFESVEKM